MPFEPYRKPSRREPQKSKSGASASLATMGPGETAASLVITVKGDAAEALGLTPDAAAPLAVLIGSGEDHGMVRIRRDDTNASVIAACRRRLDTRYWLMFLGHLGQFWPPRTGWPNRRSNSPVLQRAGASSTAAAHEAPARQHPGHRPCRHPLS